MINSIRLQNFRCYVDDSFGFEDGANIIVGPNASGKTSLIEALQMTAIGSSFRAEDADVIKHGADWARLSALTAKSERILKVQGGNADQTKKEYVIDGHKLAKLTATHKVPIVLFEPDQLRLLKGRPENRRSYLDDLLELIVPGFGQLRRNYKRALAQRNALLKQAATNQDALFVWDIRLSDLAGAIARERLGLIDKFNAGLGRIYSKIAGRRQKLAIEYKTKSTTDPDSYSTQMLKHLQTGLAFDRHTGFTNIGAHRDDFSINFDGHSASTVASRGETRTAILALKFLETGLIEAVFNTKPILLLDDVFSELDGARRQALVKVIGGHQAFITTTDADIVVKHFIGNCQIIPLA